MRTLALIWLVAAAILLVIGWYLSFTRDKKSKRARTGYSLVMVGSLMSAVYFFGSLFL